jgi:hypothetical protein
LNNILALKKTFGNKIQDIIPRTLTVIPVAACGLGFFFLLPFVSLTGGFLVSHPSSHEFLHLHVLGGLRRGYGMCARRVQM